MPKEFVIFDTEYTAWEGSQERGWSEEWEHKEIIQIGAVRVADFQEVDSYLAFIRPRVNGKLSEYIMKLTHVTQAEIDTKGVDFEGAQEAFFNWCSNLPLYSYGGDESVLKENADLIQIEYLFSKLECNDVREVFKMCGVDPSRYMSSTIPEAFGETAPPNAHDAQSDARSILIALKAANERGLLDSTD